jgi:hypothetical protein
MRCRAVERVGVGQRLGATLESGGTLGAVCTVMQRRKRGVLVVLAATVDGRLLLEVRAWVK